MTSSLNFDECIIEIKEPASYYQPFGEKKARKTKLEECIQITYCKKINHHYLLQNIILHFPMNLNELFVIL